MKMELQALQILLDERYPGGIMIPSIKGGKVPKYKHKDLAYTSEDFKTKGYKECEEGCLIILPESIIVIDVDDKDTTDILEDAIHELKETVCCETKKGKHYYFRATEYSKKSGMKDGARQMKQENGEALPIDIKTKGGTISIPPSPNKTWVRSPLCNEMLEIPDKVVNFYVDKTKSKKREESQVKVYHNAMEYEEIKHLISLLSLKRADCYTEWMNIGWCLHNIGNGDLSYLEMWDEFSRNSVKYKDGECASLWNTMRNEGLRHGSLHMWAKQDSPEKYKEYVNNRVYTEIKDCNGSHNSVAKIAYNILKGKFICASSNGKLWYEFTGTRWHEDKDGIRIRHELSTTVKEHFRLTMNKIMISNNSSTSNKTLCETLLKISFKLEDNGYKESVMKEMREYFYNGDFIRKLDSNPNLIAFNNGVWDLRNHVFRVATPEDYLSKSVGYDYINERDDEMYNKVIHYWKTLHPDPDQNNYILKTLARQLQGDVGHNLFHVHAGFQGSAGNGKTTMFDILDMCLGEYVRKFGVEMLVAKQRIETGKPMPDFQYWKGVRILYCTEPKHDDILNTGIMKDLTGGEKIMYRLLYSNDIVDFRPMFKMHIMCNDTPQVDGSDSGVKRRIRKLDYVSQFVAKEYVDETNHYYLRDDKFITQIREDTKMKMEFLRLFLDLYDHDYQYDMPEIIKKNSQMYLEENDGVFKFVQEYIEKDESGFFTLKDLKERFKKSEYYNNKIQTLKNDVQKILKIKCEEQRKIHGRNYRYVFMGYNLRYSNDYNIDDEL
jgi:phage/plasmid-associated DNA primase